MDMELSAIAHGLDPALSGRETLHVRDKTADATDFLAVLSFCIVSKRSAEIDCRMATVRSGCQASEVQWRRRAAYWVLSAVWANGPCRLSVLQA